MRTQFPALNLCSLTWICLLLRLIFNSSRKLPICSWIAPYINTRQSFWPFLKPSWTWANLSPSKTGEYFGLIPLESIFHQQLIQKSHPRSTAIHLHRAWHLWPRNRSLEEELAANNDNGPNGPLWPVAHAADKETFSLDDSAQHTPVVDGRIVNNWTSDSYLASNACKCVYSKILYFFLLSLSFFFFLYFFLLFCNHVCNALWWYLQIKDTATQLLGRRTCFLCV